MDYTGTINGEKIFARGTELRTLSRSPLTSMNTDTRWSTHFEAFSCALTLTIKAPSLSVQSSFVWYTRVLAGAAFSFVSWCAYARFTRAARETAVVLLKAASIMRVKGEKRKCRPSTGSSVGDAPSTRSSVHLFNPRRTVTCTRESVQPFRWVCFSYAWILKRVCAHSFPLWPLSFFSFIRACVSATVRSFPTRRAPSS